MIKSSHQNLQKSSALFLRTLKSSFLIFWEFEELVALKAGKHILTFNNLDSFEEVIEYIDPKTPIYIDSDLGCKIKGEQYAESLFHRGFKELYLSTGYMPEHFGDLPWIRAIVGKEPPVDFI